MSGFYLMHRGWMDNDLFRVDVTSKKDAWLWLIENACWSAWRDRGQDLERGQIYVSVRYLAKAWKWEQTKVLRFLEGAENRNMIATRTATGGTIITICNYDKYQNPARCETTPVVEEPQQDRNSDATNLKEDNNKQTNKLIFEGRTVRLTQEHWDAWAKAYPNLDLTAELQSLDDYYTAEKVGPKWFQRCSAALAKKQAQKAEEMRAKTGPMVDDVKLKLEGKKRVFGKEAELFVLERGLNLLRPPASWIVPMDWQPRRQA